MVSLVAASRAETGKLASESSVTIVAPLTGRAGITAPSPRIGSVIVGRPGLQGGRAGVLIPGSVTDNLFRLRVQPISGPTGGCRGLVQAGFFNRNQSACEGFFRP